MDGPQNIDKYFVFLQDEDKETISKTEEHREEKESELDHALTNEESGSSENIQSGSENNLKTEVNESRSETGESENWTNSRMSRIQQSNEESHVSVKSLKKTQRNKSTGIYVSRKSGSKNDIENSETVHQKLDGTEVQTNEKKQSDQSTSSGKKKQSHKKIHDPSTSKSSNPPVIEQAQDEQSNISGEVLSESLSERDEELQTIDEPVNIDIKGDQDGSITNLKSPTSAISFNRTKKR